MWDAIFCSLSVSRTVLTATRTRSSLGWTRRISRFLFKANNAFTEDLIANVPQLALPRRHIWQLPRFPDQTGSGVRWIILLASFTRSSARWSKRAS
jgi:hypothetical protein